MPSTPMPSTDATTLPTAARERRWSLAAAIASVTVFGLSVGQGGPLLPLLLEQRGLDVTLNGLNAASVFIGVIVGPLLAPRWVRLLGVRLASFDDVEPDRPPAPVAPVGQLALPL